MSSRSDIAVSVRGLSKSYAIAQNAEHHTTAAEALLHRIKNPFARVRRDTFWALNDISFELKRGDVVGVIGRNGAGKSTLLKVLSRITEPTRGEVDLYGRLGSLLEVGTGFHPELTGRENVYLNGAILGMTKPEIDREFDSIVDFAGVAQFLETPVKRYSSGMYVRLAFAVAAHLNPEIMIVDEVLAVGDAEFQKKCLGKMQDVARNGRTVLFVSHQMQAVAALCNRAIFLEKGRVTYDGSTSEAIKRYMDARQSAPRQLDEQIRRPGSGELRITNIEADRANYHSTDDIKIELDIVASHGTQPSYFISLEIVNHFGVAVLHLDSRLLNREFDSRPTRKVTYKIAAPRLAQGDYSINAYICTTGGIIDAYDGAAEFTIAPLLPYPTGRNDCAGKALVYPEFEIEDEAADSSPSVLRSYFGDAVSCPAM